MLMFHLHGFVWYCEVDLNYRPLGYQPSALTTELPQHISIYFLFKKIRAANPISVISNRLIQRGLSTHHHDQAMTPVSLRTIKTTSKTPPKLIPPELLELELIRTFLSS